MEVKIMSHSGHKSGLFFLAFFELLPKMFCIQSCSHVYLKSLDFFFFFKETLLRRKKMALMCGNRQTWQEMSGAAAWCKKSEESCWSRVNIKPVKGGLSVKCPGFSPRLISLV